MSTSDALPQVELRPPDAGPKARAILDAAGALFLDEGYPAVSMDAVARRAGVSKATLYAHFESKEALFAAIVAAGCQRMTAEAEALADVLAIWPRA